MKIAVTGGTGFVGAHAVAALLAAGHQVRLLARRPERVRPALAPLGVTVDDVVVGDVTDSAAIGRLLEGCETVVHAAAIYSHDPRQAKAMGATNAAATELVLGTAARMGLDPVVHISSVAALFPTAGASMTVDTPPGAGTDPYSASKAESERIARAMQASGAPVVSVLPGGVIGPHDPYLGESNLGIANVLRGRSPLLPRGASTALVDVRDLATLIAGTVERGRGPRRYLAAPHFRRIIELVRLAEALLDRRLPALLVPDQMALVSAIAADGLQRVLPFDLPVRSALVRELIAFRPVEDTAAWAEFGLTPRPLEESLADTVRWMLQAGHLSRRQAGRLAEEPTPILSP